VSLSGMGLYLPCPPGCDEVLVRLEPPSGGEAGDLPGRIVHVAPCPDGRYEVGLRFASAPESAAG
jgi:hypothetical protein